MKTDPIQNISTSTAYTLIIQWAEWACKKGPGVERAHWAKSGKKYVKK